MSFFEEYKKTIACLVLLIFLVVLQIVTGQDTSPWVKTLLEALTLAMVGGVAKYSVLSTSERNFLNSKVPKPPADEDDYDHPLIRNPGDNWQV